MATIILTANPALCTPGNTGENIVKFDPAFNNSIPGNGFVNAAIEIVSGTINFNTNGQPAANGASYTTAGTKFIVSFLAHEGLSVKAGSATDSFKISV
jgi:hypothetical protein